MDKYSRQLHEILIDYPQLQDSLDDPNIDKLHVYGFNALDLSGITISKTAEPRDEGNSALITITEIEESSNRDKLITVTDYIRSDDGDFSEPEQMLTIYTADSLPEANTLRQLGKLTSYLMQKFLDLEISGSNDLQISECEIEIAEAYRDFNKLFEEEGIFKSAMGEYDNTSHKRLCQKLGALVLF